MDSHAVGCRASHESASEGVAFNLNMLWLSGDSIVQIQRLAMCRIAQRDWSHPDPPSGPRIHHPVHGRTDRAGTNLGDVDIF